MNIGQRLKKIETTIDHGFINDPERAIAAMVKIIDASCTDIDGNLPETIKEKITKEEWELFLKHSEDRIPPEEIEEMKTNIIKIGGFTEDVQIH